MIYYVTFAYLLIASYLNVFVENKKLNNILLTVGFVILAGMAGFRKDVGFDYDNYVKIFNSINNLTDIYFKENVEKGYLLLNLIVKSLGLSYEALFIIMGFVTLGIICYSYKIYSPYVMVSLIFYVDRFFFIRDMGQIRSSIACAIVLLSIKYIEEQKLWKFLGIIFIASIFHKVALVAIPVYFIKKIKLSDEFMVLILLFSIKIGNSMILPNIFNMFGDYLPTRITNYFYATTSASSMNPVAIMQVGILIGFLLFRDKLKVYIKNYDTILIMYWLSTVILFFLDKNPILAGRTSTVLATVEPIIIASFIYAINKRIAYVGVLAFAIGLFYINFIYRLYENYFPYHSIFFY